MATHFSALERIVQPGQGSLQTALAEYILQLDFPPEDHARYLELSAKVQTGTLTAEETAQPDDLLLANNVLTILQSKARTSLNRRTPAA
jgi:hypothetical protein